MKFRTGCAKAIIIASAMTSTLAFAESANHVYIEKDQLGNDNSINIEIRNSQDIHNLKTSFAPHSIFKTARETFTIDCQAENQCLISLHQDGAEYRQRYDELIKDYDLDPITASQLFHHAWNTEIQQETCQAEHCTHFEVKRFRDQNGKLMLQCNAQVLDSGKRNEPNCFIRVYIADIIHD